MSRNAFLIFLIAIATISPLEPLLAKDVAAKSSANDPNGDGGKQSPLPICKVVIVKASGCGSGYATQQVCSDGTSSDPECTPQNGNANSAGAGT